jgi:TldD protein
MPVILKTYLLLAAVAGGAAQPSSDVVLNAMEDELARSKSSLELTGHDKPFIVEYNVRDSESYAAMGSFGALSLEACRRSRSLNSNLLLGDYKLNSSNNSYGWSDNGAASSLFSALSRGRNSGAQLPIDDNYFGLRRAIWRDTDSKYKKAIENFAAKKAYMVANKTADRPDDLVKVEPIVVMNPIGKLVVDKTQWQANVKDLSSIFRAYPRIQKSVVAFATGNENRWYINSEGFKNRTTRPATFMLVMAAANRDDGSRAFDCDFIMRDNPQQLPPETELKKQVKELAERVEQLRKAKPITEDYDGPVLFEGEAAAQFLADTLAPNLGNSGEGGMFSSSNNRWREKLGLKVLPTFVSVVDDPNATQIANVTVYGGRPVDDDGVRPEKITLIDHGVLKTFCMSRIPTRQLSTTNGHSVNGVGMPSNLILTADGACSKDKLRERLIQEGKEQGLKYVYIIRRMASSLSSITGGDSGNSDSSTLPPLCAYQVSVADGKEELVRDVYFTHLTNRILRDIEAAADDARPYPILSGNVSNTFTSPSILIKDVEFQPRTGKPTKNDPILANPFFERTLQQ